MSRVAKKPINLPAGVQCNHTNELFCVKGIKGTLSVRLNGVGIVVESNRIILKPQDAQSTKMAGTIRSLIHNMVHGVTEGYQLKLELVGVGYRASLQGKDLNLTLGFSHPINFKAPEGITFEVPSQTEIHIKGIDKQLVGQVAAKIRAFRSPEPYKGKGVRYSGEQINLKEAKKA